MAIKLLPPWTIYHVPHDSKHIPVDVRDQFVLNDTELDSELLRMTDHHTCRLFLREPEDLQTVYSPVSRLVVDMERFRNDENESMAEIGMGAVYTSTSDLRPLRRQLDPAEKEQLLRRYYDPHHAELEERVAATLTAYGRALIIDCHSYPSQPLKYERCAGLPESRPEVCIGTDDFHTPKVLSDGLMSAFNDQGFDVQLNRPFAGAMVPTSRYRTDSRVFAVMIEVRRDLYLEEQTGRWRGDFNQVANKIHNTLGAGLIPLELLGDVCVCCRTV